MDSPRLVAPMSLWEKPKDTELQSVVVDGAKLGHKDDLRLGHLSNDQIAPPLCRLPTGDNLETVRDSTNSNHLSPSNPIFHKVIIPISSIYFLLCPDLLFIIVIIRYYKF